MEDIVSYLLETVTHDPTGFQYLGILVGWLLHLGRGEASD